MGVCCDLAKCRRLWSSRLRLLRSSSGSGSRRSSWRRGGDASGDSGTGCGGGVGRRGLWRTALLASSTISASAPAGAARADVTDLMADASASTHSETL